MELEVNTGLMAGLSKGDQELDVEVVIRNRNSRTNVSPWTVNEGRDVEATMARG